MGGRLAQHLEDGEPLDVGLVHGPKCVGEDVRIETQHLPGRRLTQRLEDGELLDANLGCGDMAQNVPARSCGLK